MTNIVCLVVDPAPQRLQSPAFGLALQPSLFRGLARLGGFALLAWNRNTLNQLAEPIKRIRSVLLLAPRLLGLDGDHAILRYAMVPQLQEFFLIKRRQRGGGDVEPQMNRRRDLVDVLAAGPLRPYGMDLDLVIRNGDVGGNVQHWDYVDRTELSQASAR